MIDRETLSVESKLYISKVSPNMNENTIKCVVNQENQKELESNELKMDIRFKPVAFISFQSQNENTLERVASDGAKVLLFENMNNSVAFKCNYRANPKINEKIVWLRNGLVVKNGNTYFSLN